MSEQPQHADFYDDFWFDWRKVLRAAIRPIYWFDENARWAEIFFLMSNLCGVQGRGRTVFDVGAGRGDLARRMARKGWRVKGIEMSPRAAAFASSCPGVEITAGDMFRHEYPKDLDLIISSEVAEHISVEQRGEFAAIFENLASGGVGIVTTPNRPVCEIIGAAKEQPIENWMNMAELCDVFKDYEILHAGTTCWTPRSKIINRLYKFLPILPQSIDRYLRNTERGKYLVLACRKRI